MQPERFDHFMARANAAYYAQHNPFDDFVTAPELTQVFGEVLGAWARVVWQMMGSPPDIHLVEAGGGRGVMMADMLRNFPAANVHFIETSARLQAEQNQRVPHAHWHQSLADLPAGDMIIIGNEFLDALPVRQFICRDGVWHERFVADGAYVEQPTAISLASAPDNTVQELNETAAAFVRGIAKRNAIGLFIDYGPMQSAAGESVQAIYLRKFSNPLEVPGAADITAHVDFAALAQAARAAGAATQGPIKQNAFLTALGFMQRTDQLAQRNPAMAQNLRLAAQRLTDPTAMGSLFKVMAVCPANFPTLPGFET
ncbi:MAG: SAM-dependent methyltransferase [Acidocella sp.]|nr:SAM-dependent methyltransferase [Acidocella sp.]